MSEAVDSPRQLTAGRLSPGTGMPVGGGILQKGVVPVKVTSKTTTVLSRLVNDSKILENSHYVKIIQEYFVCECETW